MKKLLILFVAISILGPPFQAQSTGDRLEPSAPQKVLRVLPLDAFRGKDVVATTYREALDAFNANKRESLIASLKVGDIFMEGDRPIGSKDDLLKEIAASNKKKIQAYKDSLGMDGEYYVVEGDLLLTDKDIPEYLSLTSRLKEYKYLQEGESMVNIHEGEDDFYRTNEKRKLTYAFDRQSFSSQQYEQVVSEMSLAAKEWQDICPSCGITITHLEDPAVTPSSERANFIVRSHNASGLYLASAFFPHEVTAQRNLNIDPLFFGIQSSVDRIGILAHQLGHVLGYRHVQPKDIAGCYYKDSSFLALSRYPRSSLMQPYCSGDQTLPSRLSQSDMAFHRKTYDVPKLNTVGGDIVFDAANVLVTQYQGGDVAGNIAAVIRELIRLNLIRIGTHKVVGSEETVKTIYQAHLRVPVFSEGLAQLANELNKGSLKNEFIEVGAEVVYPDVEFNYYEQTLTLDPDSKEDKAFEKDLGERNLIVKQSGKGPLKLVTVKAYELRLAMGSHEQLMTAVDSLVKLISHTSINNVLVSSQGIPDRSLEKPAQPGSLPKETRPQLFVASLTPTGEAPPIVRSQCGPASEPPSATPTPTPQRVEDDPVTNIEDIAGFFAGWEVQGVKVGAEGGLRFLTDMSIVPPSVAGYRCNPKLDCPEIILVDTEVYPHPDLEGAYKKCYPTEDKESVTPEFSERFSQKEGGRQKIWLAQGPPTKDEHGTFMAGIIASRPNKYGIVGLAPDAQFYSVNWDVFSNNRLALKELIAERDRNGQKTRRQQIVVFATSWRLVQDKDRDKDKKFGRLLREGDRWTDSLASYIKDSQTLLVVAAIGQPDQDDDDRRPREIDQLFPDGPMNLGDLDNVIIVTACEDCYGPSPQIMGIANVPAKNADSMVHIAAPGAAVPSTVKPAGDSDIRYAKGSGTSPATAIVAGVVFEMISYWPGSYKLPFQAKRRIQVTARPTIVSKEGRLQLALGVLDPTIALRDPAKNWLKDNDSSWNEIGEFCWIEESIPVRNPETNEKAWLNATKILRINRTKRAGKDYWSFYMEKTDSKGLIVRQGPFVIDENFQKDRDLIVESTDCRDPKGVKFRLNQITDVILADSNDRLAIYSPTN